MLNEFGGPTQYLKHELGGSPNEKWSDFAASLQAAFPQRPDQDEKSLTECCPGTAVTSKCYCGRWGWEDNS